MHAGDAFGAMLSGLSSPRSAAITVPAGDYLLQAKTTIFSTTRELGGNRVLSDCPHGRGRTWHLGRDPGQPARNSE